VASGWKVSGFANWSLTDPYPRSCTECGTAMTLLFTADSGKWRWTGGSWRPLEEVSSNSPMVDRPRFRPVRRSLPGLF